MIVIFNRELYKQVTGCSGGSDYANEGLVDHLLTFRNSAVLRAHISFQAQIHTDFHCFTEIGQIY